MKIYNTGTAPNPRRVRVFLAEKGVEVPYEEVDIVKGGQPRSRIQKEKSARQCPSARTRRRHLHIGERSDLPLFRKAPSDRFPSTLMPSVSMPKIASSGSTMSLLAGASSLAISSR